MNKRIELICQKPTNFRVLPLQNYPTVELSSV